MDSSALNLISWAFIVAIVIYAAINAVQHIGDDELISKFKEEPKKASLGFISFSQGLAATTPAYKAIDGKVLIPYPDSTDILGLFIFAAIAVLIIRISPLREKPILAILFFIAMLLCGWVVWKIFMYYTYLWGAEQLGMNYSQAAAIRAEIMEKEKAVAAPIIALSVFTLLMLMKSLPRPE